MVRDNQRSRVYKWERTLPGWYEADAWIGSGNGSSYRSGSGKPPIELEKIREFIAWAWEDFYQTLPPHVKDGRAARRATGSSFQISLPRWARSPMIILHELAHAMSHDKHGPEFVRVFISLLVRYLGMNESELIKSAKASGVKVANWHSRPKPRRRVTKYVKGLLVV